MKSIYPLDFQKSHLIFVEIELKESPNINYFCSNNDWKKNRWKIDVFDHNWPFSTDLTLPLNLLEMQMKIPHLLIMILVGDQ